MFAFAVLNDCSNSSCSMHITKTEEKKFVSFQKGEERGFDFFFNEYYACLSFFAFKILRHDAEAQDVVSDSFVKLWERRKMIDKTGSIKSYLYTTVKNACVDILRRREGSRKLENEISALSNELKFFEPSYNNRCLFIFID